MNNRRHGMWKSPEYRAWRAMLARTTSYSKDAVRYADRGIIVCERWAAGFEAFFADMGPKPGPAYSIDREDNDGPYSPENCRWATATQQQRNTSRNHLFTIRGETLSIAEWAERFGLSWSAMYSRVKRGWTEDRFTPHA